MNQDDDNAAAELSWNLRIAPRARYAKLQIRPFGGLEVVIPPRFPRAQIPRLVEKHADWARRQLALQAGLRHSIELPGQLNLAFDDSRTPVIYTCNSLEFNYDLFAARSTRGIFIDADTQAGQIRQLQAWIRRRAREQLPPLLNELSAKTGLEFDRLGIRSQKTRWGSCSARGHISLNDQLLFLPAPAVEYLMIHELCHTRYLNHSASFWALVKHHCPDFEKQEKFLRRSRDLVPDWYLLGLYS
jgi:predicted metal-dependent hydrolase